MPEADYSGPDSFQYTISDGHGGTDTATVDITVTPENTAPVAADDGIATVEDDTDSANVLLNDTDVDGDLLSVTTPSPAAAHGTVSCTTGGVCVYTPDADYNGVDSFDYTVPTGAASPRPHPLGRERRGGEPPVQLLPLAVSASPAPGI
jgi:Bacterial Ig domain